MPKIDPSWNLKRLDEEIERSLLGSERENWQTGEDIMWLMGWADLMIERAFYEDGGDARCDGSTDVPNIPR